MTPRTHYWGLGHQVSALSLQDSLIIFVSILALAAVMLTLKRAYG